MDAAHDYEPGHMDIREQRETFHAFLKLVKWGCLALAVGLLFFSMWLCTDTSILGAGFAALVLLVVGIVLLREKGPRPGAH